MQKFRTGVIGLGFIGPAHIEALRRLGCVDVVAVAAPHDVEAKADALGIERGYSDWKEMLEKEELDTVHICTPNNLHYEMTKAALEKGLHVVCDKPLSMTVEQGKELVQLAEEKKLVCAVNFNVRFYPLIHHARELIKAGELGEILSVTGSYLQDWLLYDTDYSWRLEPEKSGRSRAVADIGSHWCDTAEFMCGMKIEEVCAEMATFLPIRKKPAKAIATYSGMLDQGEMEYEEVPIDTEDYASMLLRFPGGVKGAVTISQTFAGCKNRILFEIAGTKASLRIDTENPNEMWIGHRDRPNEIIVRGPDSVAPAARDIVTYPGGHAEGFPDTFKQNFGKYYGYLMKEAKGEAGEIDFPTFRDGLRELEVCEAVLKSAQEGAWVKID